MSALAGMNGEQGRADSRRKHLLWAGAGLLLLVASLGAFLICRFEAEKAQQEILDGQHGIQETMLAKALAQMALWRGELQQQARLACASELLSSFVRDMAWQDETSLARLADPKTLLDDDEDLRAQARQLNSAQNLLGDFSRSRHWRLARLARADGAVLAETGLAPPLSPDEQALVKLAAESGQTVFGSLRREEKALVIDLAEPLPAPTGAEADRPRAALLLSLAVGKALSDILASGGENAPALLLRLVLEGRQGLSMLFVRDGQIIQEAVTPTLAEALEQANLPFALRESLDGLQQVYSLGVRSSMEGWRLVAETPAAFVQSRIKSQRGLIYGLGLAGVVCMALLGALGLARASDRSQKARVRQLEMLNATIGNQKALLDGVNASLRAGLALVDSEGRILMANRAFCALAGDRGEIPWGTPLVEVLPGKVAVRLLSDMALVHACGQSATVEVELPPKAQAATAPGSRQDQAGEGGERLFRVSLSPYGVDAENCAPGSSGCVAAFLDITSDRRNAERARQRQVALISALVRAIESVDANLRGHSDKMASAAALVAQELNLDPHERETLDLAARLSQIGKIFVPRELLTKREALTPRERQEVLRAPEHADAILHDLRFDLPVRETVREMGERMDGSGSPHGLQGEEISRCGRVLAVVNAFVAMTSPRAWRDNTGMTTAEAVRQLALDLRFDLDVVRALARVMGVDLADGNATGEGGEPA